MLWDFTACLRARSTSRQSRGGSPSPAPAPRPGRPAHAAGGGCCRPGSRARAGADDRCPRPHVDALGIAGHPCGQGPCPGRPGRGLLPKTRDSPSSATTNATFISPWRRSEPILPTKAEAQPHQPIHAHATFDGPGPRVLLAATSLRALAQDAMHPEPPAFFAEAAQAPRGRVLQGAHRAALVQEQPHARRRPIASGIGSTSPTASASSSSSTPRSPSEPRPSIMRSSPRRSRRRRRKRSPPIGCRSTGSCSGPSVVLFEVRRSGLGIRPEGRRPDEVGRPPARR